MARRFDGQTFVTCYNNGVDALARIEVRDHFRALQRMASFLKEIDQEKAANALLRRFATDAGPIFTFVHRDRLKVDTVYSGSTEMFHKACRLIEEGGGRVEVAGVHVPFSNGTELGYHGEEARLNEMVWKTTPTQVLELMGVMEIHA